LYFNYQIDKWTTNDAKTKNKYKGITKTNATVSTTTIPVWSKLGKTSYETQNELQVTRKRNK